MLKQVLAIASIACASPALAQDVDAGQANYERYCAACHGIAADGQGSMQPVLTIPPTDLTQLTKANAGIFPLVRVIKRIDGRDPLVSHGSPMPVYGDFFEGEDMTIKTPAGQPVLTSRPVVDLVTYLQSLQVPSD
jgi:cytochrome c